MRIVVTSDTHRNSRDFFDIIDRHEKNADLFINLGDSEREIETLKLTRPEINIKCVCGNCDFYSDYPIEQVIKFDGKKVFFTHGHKYHVKHGYDEIIRRAEVEEAEICLFGHTHEPYTERINNILYMNPGAVLNGSYGIIDIEKGQIMAYTNKI